MALLLFLLFCLDCRIWTHAKINYVFIFEFDSRHNLDWRQLSEVRASFHLYLLLPKSNSLEFFLLTKLMKLQLPCLFFFLLGLFLWLNFQQSATDVMYLYWPVVLIGLSVLIMFFPGPVLYHRSREWWAYSNVSVLDYFLPRKNH